MRYYFDIVDGDKLTADGTGLDFADDAAAIADALRSLTDWSEDIGSGSKSRAVSLVIRDERGQLARLTMRIEIEFTRSLAREPSAKGV